MMTEQVGMPDDFLERAARLVADRDPLRVLAATPQRLQSIVETHTLEQLRARPHAGKWTPLEIIGHLVDHEVATGIRLRTILADEQPVIDSYPQERWVSVLQHNTRDPVEFLAIFDVLRGESLRLWRLLHDPHDSALSGREITHTRRGALSMRTFCIMNAGHDLSHLDQIDRYLAAIGLPV